MSSYLSIELHTEYKLYGGNLRSVGAKADEYIAALKENQPIAMELYEVIKEGDDDDYSIRLKDAAIVDDLLPFLWAFCRDFYPSERDYGKDLEQLKHCKTYDDLEALTETCYYPLIRNHQSKKIYFSGSGLDDVALYSDGLMLTLEGKVFVEDLDKSFMFFEKMIKKAYVEDFPIVKSITVSIV